MLSTDCNCNAQVTLLLTKLHCLIISIIDEVRFHSVAVGHASSTHQTSTQASKERLPYILLFIALHSVITSYPKGVVFISESVAIRRRRRRCVRETKKEPSDCYLRVTRRPTMAATAAVAVIVSIPITSPGDGREGFTQVSGQSPLPFARPFSFIITFDSAA